VSAAVTVRRNCARAGCPNSFTVAAGSTKRYCDSKGCRRMRDAARQRESRGKKRGEGSASSCARTDPYLTEPPTSTKVRACNCGSSVSYVEDGAWYCFACSRPLEAGRFGRVNGWEVLVWDMRALMRADSTRTRKPKQHEWRTSARQRRTSGATASPEQLVLEGVGR
jgi:hypothetical protein